MHAFFNVFIKVKKHVFYVFLFENQCFYHLWSEALATDLAVLAAKSISYRLVGPINLVD